MFKMPNLFELYCNGQVFYEIEMLNRINIYKY